MEYLLLTGFILFIIMLTANFIRFTELKNEVDLQVLELKKTEWEGNRYDPMKITFDSQTGEVKVTREK